MTVACREVRTEVNQREGAVPEVGGLVVGHRRPVAGEALVVLSSDQRRGRRLGEPGGAIAGGICGAVMLAPALTLCVPPLNRSVPPVALNGPVCVLVPAPEKESVPLVMLTVPTLLKTTPTVAVPELRVRLKVPWLLNVLPVPKLAIVLSFWISKLPEAWLLKMAPLAMARARL